MAAYGIVATHVAFQTATGSAVLERFDYFVAVFFALSAFLLARGGLREGYYSRRLARLAPAYVVCVAVVLLALPPLAGVTWGQAAANLMLVQVYVPHSLIDGLTQMWSLCIEAAFYVALPLYLRLDGRGRRAALAGSVVLGLAWPWAVSGISDPAVLNVQIWPPSYAPWFAVGLVLAELERARVRYAGPRWPFPVLALPVAFTAAMTLCDTTNGLGMMRLYSSALQQSERRRRFNLVVTSVSAVSALFIAVLTLGAFVHELLGLTDPVTTWLAEVDLGHAGLALVGVFALIWLCAALLEHRHGRVRPVGDAA